MILSVPVTTFSCPEEGQEAEDAFLAILRNEEVYYLEMYGDTLLNLYHEIEAADASGIVGHIYLDHTQESGPTEKPLVMALVGQLKHTDLTIGTAGPDAKVPGQIAHRKRIMDVKGRVFFGSINASEAGFHSQTNDAVYFESLEYVQAAIPRFEARRAWARQHQAAAQVQTIALAVAAPIMAGPVVSIPANTTAEVTGPAVVVGTQEGI